MCARTEINGMHHLEPYDPEIDTTVVLSVRSGHLRQGLRSPPLDRGLLCSRVTDPPAVSPRRVRWVGSQSGAVSACWRVEPERHVNSYRRTERLRHRALRTGDARPAALFQLSTELPAAPLARMLGLHITVTVAWQRAGAGDWTGYAAEVGRRPEKEPS